ncbi:hypothetical protein BST81_08820 [Leptolyngbya sp. 'hensonii']|nr:hypothetical protein BST81_08820 [Leptolyngbya sp. 'hensonii']
MDTKELLTRYAAGERNFRGVALMQVDLTGADLQGIDLSEAQLCFAVLSHANLTGANLTAANLNGTEVVRANLHKAKLARAQMIGANFSMAILTQADLTGAILSWVNFTKANLGHANLTQASLDWVVMLGTQLHGSKLTQARLSGANLAKANLNGADISDIELTEDPRLPIILPDGNRYVPRTGTALLLELERFIGDLGEAKARQMRSQAQETQLIKDFMKGQFELLANYKLQTKATFDAIQLWTNRGELIASLKLANQIRQALVKHTSEYWGMIDEILRRKCFVPTGVSKYEGYLEYEYQSVPEGYQINFTEARFLWRAWRRQQNKSKQHQIEFLILHDRAWQVVRDVITAEGSLFITTATDEVTLYSTDGAVWLSPTSDLMHQEWVAMGESGSELPASDRNRPSVAR